MTARFLGRAGERRARPAVGGRNSRGFIVSMRPTGEKFGIPFIICVRRHSKDSILRQFERRLRQRPPPSSRRRSRRSSASSRCVSITGRARRPPARCTAGCRPMCSTRMPDVPPPGVAIELIELSADGERRADRDAPHQSGRPHRRSADRRAADADRTLRAAFPHRRLFRRAGSAAVADPPFLDVVPVAIRRRRAGGPLSRAAAGDAVELPTYRGS